jgi:predicted ATPase/tRNA A-37 threonylcarbamoyl transferase component Bud32
MSSDDPLRERLEAALPDRYRILDLAGRGGMATVFRARDEKHQREVALKVLHSEVAGAVAGARFLREIRIAAGLQHPHIVPLYDSGEAEGLLYYVMPYMEGPSLRDHLRPDRPLSLDEALAIARDVGSALTYAHGRGIVHRDLKPDNIMLTQGAVVVSDFGIARALTEAGSDSLTATGMVVGTPAYLSPEQATGSKSVDARSDLYSLACMVFEMLAGTPPFSGATAWALIAQHHSTPPPPLSSRRPGVTPSVSEAVQRAMSKDPDDRFPSVEEFLEALRTQGDAGTTWRAEAPPAPRLPVPPTPLVGRDEERDRLTDLLSRDDVRLVTLTGPGGTGKTRLALELATTLSESFPDGVWFIPLASITDPDRVGSAVASALEVRLAEGESVDHAVVRFLGSRKALLVLDNFEQIASGAPRLGPLLESTRELKILVTSRTVLHIRGEHEFPVPALTLPDLEKNPSLETLEGIPSVRLFVDRARALRPDFTLSPDAAAAVARICIRLDGLPLAIELAAARTRMLTPEALLARLGRRLDLLEGGARDLPQRQQTLRATLDWSHNLLSPAEQAVLRRFAVFAGGAPLEAAETVCGEELEEDPLDLLGSLVDQSLLVRDLSSGGTPRLRMLETIREYALEALEADPAEEAAAHHRHFTWSLGFALNAEPHFTGGEQARWLAAVAREHDNLRAALDWGERTPATSREALRGAVALWRFWLVRGHLSEGRDRITRLLELAGGGAPPELEGQALAAVGMLEQNLGDYESAQRFLARSLEIFRELEDDAGIAAGLTRLGWVRWRQCEYGEARSRSEEALALHRKLGDAEGTAHALNNLAWTALFEGNPEEALHLYDEALEIRTSLGDRRGIAFLLTMKGWSLVHLEEPARAEEMLRKAITLKREVGERQLLAFAHAVLAKVLLAQGHPREADALLRDEALPVFRELGDRWGAALAHYLMGRVSEALDDPSGAKEWYLESLGIREAIGDRHGADRCRERLQVLGEEAPPGQAM